MNILIFTFGTRGDVQPYVALGVALKAQGHSVTVSTGQGFDEMITGHGLSAAAASIDFREIVNSPEGQDALRTVSGKFKALRAFKDLVRQNFEEMWEIANEVRPQGIIYHPKGYAAPHIAEALSVIAIPTTLQPMFVPTGDFPNPVLPFRNLIRFGNRLTHAFLEWVTSKGQASLLGNWRQERLGLAHKAQRFFFEGYDPQGKEVPRLHGYSSQLVTKPHEWTEREHITGYWFMEPHDWQPPKALEEFLQADPPPVCVGFGSMPAKDAKRQTQIIIDALHKSGQRGVLITGWAALPTPRNLSQFMFWTPRHMTGCFHVAQQSCITVELVRLTRACVGGAQLSSARSVSINPSGGGASWKLGQGPTRCRRRV